MSERKTLASGLGNSDVQTVDVSLVRQFVKSGIEPRAINENAEKTKGAANEFALAAAEPSQIKRSTKKSPPVISEMSGNTRIRPVGLVPVTVRLSPYLAGALKRASLERQLAGESMFTQQDIVQSLLEPWLKREGFL